MFLSVLQKVFRVNSCLTVFVSSLPFPLAVFAAGPYRVQNT